MFYLLQKNTHTLLCRCLCTGRIRRKYPQKLFTSCIIIKSYADTKLQSTKSIIHLTLNAPKLFHEVYVPIAPSSPSILRFPTT